MRCDGKHNQDVLKQTRHWTEDEEEEKEAIRPSSPSDRDEIINYAERLLATLLLFISNTFGGGGCGVCKRKRINCPEEIRILSNTNTFSQ